MSREIKIRIWIGFAEILDFALQIDGKIKSWRLGFLGEEEGEPKDEPVEKEKKQNVDEKRIEE